MSEKVMPEWISNLEEEELSFIKNFILVSGSLKEAAALYSVTYPTVRLRLDRLIQKIQIRDEMEEAPFVRLVKELALKEQVDFEAAKALIAAYKKEREEG